MENAKGKLQTKLTQLGIHAKRTQQVLDSGSVEAIERHTGALRSTISEADELKRASSQQRTNSKVGKETDKEPPVGTPKWALNEG